MDRKKLIKRDRERERRLKEELALPPEKLKELQKYRQKNEEKLKELMYENRNGFYPPKPWYED